MSFKGHLKAMVENRYMGQVCFSIKIKGVWILVFVLVEDQDGFWILESLAVEYARTGDGSDFWHVQDESGFSDPHCSQTIGHRGY